MSIKSFTQIFVCATMLSMSGAMLSCSQNDEAKAELIIKKLSAYSSYNDSLLSIHIIDLTQKEKDMVIDMVSDSTIEFRALTAATILSHEELTKYVFENPSRELVNEISNRLMQLDGADAVTAFATSLDASFKSLSAVEQALFLTKVASPAECATHLESTDCELKAEIEKIYANSDDKSALTQFEQSLK